jgi:hypothetical protein
METKIEFLSTLEQDLRAAVERERARGRGGTHASGQTAVRAKRWPALVAAVVALLMVSGGIGFLALQRTMRSDALGDEGGGGVAAPGTIAGPGKEPSTHEGVGFRGPSLPSASPAPHAGQDRDLTKIIRDGRIGVVVPDGSFATAADRIRAIAEANAGFVLSSSTRARSGDFVLRIPSSRFDVAMTQLAAIGSVEYQNQSGKDVTAQFIDLQARKRILLARKAVLLRFLAKATSVQETLSIYSRVEDTQFQLERIQGEINFIRDQVSESTVRVELREKAAKRAEPEAIVDNPSIGHAWDRAIQGFLNVVAAVVIGLGYLVPVGAVALLLWWLVVVTRRRRAEA